MGARIEFNATEIRDAVQHLAVLGYLDQTPGEMTNGENAASIWSALRIAGRACPGVRSPGAVLSGGGVLGA